VKYHPAVFITFEGGEGAGKTTVIGLVADRLREEGRDVITTREPGAGPLGARIREILLHSDEMSARAELFLFLADRANHVETVIRPALEAGKWVLSDRFADSTFVYQSVVRGLDSAFVRDANAFATGNLVPELTLLLDLDVPAGLARLQSKDRLDAEPLAFHEAVRAGFLEEARRDPERWRVLDASQSPSAVAEAALDAIARRASKP
jgi:dTMP kinase